LQLLSALILLAGLSFLAVPLHNNLIDQLPIQVIVVVIYFMGVMGVRQPFLYPRSMARTERQGVAEVHQSSESDSAKKAANDDSQWQQLNQLMKQEKPYLQSNLNVAELAGRLGVLGKKLSQLIKLHGNCHFFDYINQHRVEYAKQLLSTDEKKLAIIDIAIESGFNSRSPFYAQFKKQTGLTPSEYRGQLK
jgi:YesN/AraC family two-component response regulator